MGKTDDENKKTNKPLYALFYYDRRKLKLLLAFNLIVLAALVVFGKNIFYPQIPAGLLVILLWFFSTLASAHVCFFPQKLAIVTDEEIKIDDNAPLKWKNIAEANEIFAGPGPPGAGLSRFARLKASNAVSLSCSAYAGICNLRLFQFRFTP